MVTKLKEKITDAKSIRPSKFNLILLGIFVAYNAILIGLSIYKRTYRFNFEFFQVNVIELIAAFIVIMTLFYLSYRQVQKKKPTFGIILAFICLIGIVAYQIAGINILLEQLFHKASFSNSNIIFTFFSLIIFSAIISQYDLPTIDSWKKLYFAIKENIYKNLGLYFVLAFVIAYGAFVNQIWIYGLSALIIIDLVYISKVLLSNLRK